MATEKQERARQKATATRSKLGNHRAKNAMGVVRADEIFSIDAFAERIGTTRHGILEMRRRGLIARKCGENRVMILGSDYHDFLKSCVPAELAAK